MECYDIIKDPLQCTTVDISIEKENNVVLTREEFFHHLSQLRAENQVERLQELEETWNAILRVNDRVKASYDQGVLNGEKIVNLADKVEVVYQKVDKLDVKIDALTKRCPTLRQRMMEEIPEIQGKDAVESVEPTQLSPSHEESIITIELADICANAIVINYDLNFRDNTSTKNASIPSSSTSSKKSNTVSQKVSSNPNNPPFSCEICGQEYLLKASLRKHKSRKHSDLTSRAGSGENRPRVEKRFWCSHCNRAKSCANHELVCSKKTAQPSATASTTKGVSQIPESGKNVRTSKRFGGKGQPGKTSSGTDFFNCPFCQYWAYRSTTLMRHVEKYHKAQQ
ncbi:hypothetical protein DAPPUDRAFT_316461 [Daphnia pulex]|uniref:C2H2-type domain-containing protein n=1 Tax=Daphnia pulex TaxID=6669 RepID=E9GD01_DAPPU|nr:hypothetical protein DAPPUDRAFT_316461 [Daphnia pulex]|eukprot:EFX82645.1 hypothetical protein DAPPUDRAFT_316461 [Daphnia pulex]